MTGLDLEVVARQHAYRAWVADRMVQSWRPGFGKTDEADVERLHDLHILRRVEFGSLRKVLLQYGEPVRVADAEYAIDFATGEVVEREVTDMGGEEHARGDHSTP